MFRMKRYVIWFIKNIYSSYCFLFFIFRLISFWCSLSVLFLTPALPNPCIFHPQSLCLYIIFNNWAFFWVVLSPSWQLYIFFTYLILLIYLWTNLTFCNNISLFCPTDLYHRHTSPCQLQMMLFLSTNNAVRITYQVLDLVKLKSLDFMCQQNIVTSRN